MVIRGTTPYHIFTLPFLSDEIKEISLIYSQNGENLILKQLDEIEIYDIQPLLENASMKEKEKYSIISKVDDITESSLLIVHLTQDETFNFTFYKAEEKNIALAQIQVININDDIFVSRPIKIRIYGNIKDGVV